jgi:outer membrane protein OmpA-like peptidoglycan-associated protein
MKFAQQVSSLALWERVGVRERSGARRHFIVRGGSAHPSIVRPTGIATLTRHLSLLAADSEAKALTRERIAAADRADNRLKSHHHQEGTSMLHSVMPARKPILGPLAILLSALATSWLCLPNAVAEQQGLDPQSALSEAQAELEALQDSYEDSLEARARCERALNISRGRIEGLKATAGRVTSTWDLVDSLLALSAESTEQGIRLRLPQGEVAFRSGTAELPPGKMPSLEEIAALLIEHRELDALVEGHTDSAGTAAMNMALSQQRADAVRQALIALGVAPERLSARGIGAARPVATNATSAGRRENRRVEVYLMR